MANASDEKLARMLEQHKDRPWYAWADIVTNGEVVMMVTELQARRAADAGMREALNVATNAIQWMSAASDFAPEGKAHEGWKSIRRDMEKIAAALGARAVEVDLPDYLRFGEPDMFPPAQK